MDAPASVHMTEKTHHPDRLDQTLLSEMEVVQRVVTLGRAARNDANLKVRQPLARLLARVPDENARDRPATRPFHGSFRFRVYRALASR
jgi:isoleucyl-tRNA synthetase